jgi:hypothetical protein
VLNSLFIEERKRQARSETPSLLAIDSQTVKIMQFVEEVTGIEGNKHLKGGNVVSPLIGWPCLGF